MAGGMIFALACLAYLGGAMLTGYVAARCDDISPFSLTIMWPVVWVLMLPVLAIRWAIKMGERR